MTTACTECQCSTIGLSIIVSSILIVLLVIAGIIIITILVLVVIRQNNKIQLLRYVLDKLTLLIINKFSTKTLHEDITMTTSPAYSVVKTNIM